MAEQHLAIPSNNQYDETSKYVQNALDLVKVLPGLTTDAAIKAGKIAVAITGQVTWLAGEVKAAARVLDEKDKQFKVMQAFIDSLQADKLRLQDTVQALTNVISKNNISKETVVAEKNEQVNKKVNCKDGADCKYLARTGYCKFKHTPEVWASYAEKRKEAKAKKTPVAYVHKQL